jgi:hypothetical protein
VTELKNVLSNSRSGSSSISSVKRRLMLLHNARSVASSPSRSRMCATARLTNLS